MPAIYYSDGVPRTQTGRRDHKGATWSADWWLGRPVSLQAIRTQAVSCEDGVLEFANGMTLKLDEANLRLVRGTINVI